MTVRNPFTPSFGIVPPFMAGREGLIEDLSGAFANGIGDPNLSTVLSGPRGSGKTALLSFMADEAASQGWVSANTTAAEGMLDDILDQATVSASNFLDAIGGRKLKGITIGQFVGIEWENEPVRAGNWRTQMNALLDQLKESEVGLLITVDEVKADIAEMKQLVRVYQHFVREGRKVALLMAGLPHAVSGLLNDDDVSFLRRARRHSLGRIPDGEIRDAMMLTIAQGGRSIVPGALDASVAAVDGFPYMMQLVGYRIWAEDPSSDAISEHDAARGIELARKEMEEGILSYTYNDLSKGDRRFLAAMLPDAQESSLAAVAERMGVKSNYASQYKRRLLEQGVIGEYQKGYVRIDIPGFKEYLQERLACE